MSIAGSELVARSQLDSALSVFRLNTEMAPESWRAWDNLGETLAALGRREAAIAAYRRSVRLNVRSLGGYDALKRLGGL